MPTCHAKNIYEIDLDFFKSLNIKYLFVDLDNTLDSYRSLSPNQRAISFIKGIEGLGITPLIISNNHGDRVKNYAKALNLNCLYSTRKPFSYKIKRLLKEKNITPDEVLMVGDQMITDVSAANGAKIKVVLTDKLVKEDQWSTHINRFFERPIRSYCNKHHKFKDWRECYGKN